jgi:hypothetical protein
MSSNNYENWGGCERFKSNIDSRSKIYCVSTKNETSRIATIILLLKSRGSEIPL